MSVQGDPTNGRRLKKICFSCGHTYASGPCRNCFPPKQKRRHEAIATTERPSEHLRSDNIGGGSVNMKTIPPNPKDQQRSWGSHLPPSLKRHLLRGAADRAIHSPEIVNSAPSRASDENSIPTGNFPYKRPAFRGFTDPERYTIASNPSAHRVTKESYFVYDSSLGPFAYERFDSGPPFSSQTVAPGENEVGGEASRSIHEHTAAWGRGDYYPRSSSGGVYESRGINLADSAHDLHRGRETFPGPLQHLPSSKPELSVYNTPNVGPETLCDNIHMARSLGPSASNSSESGYDFYTPNSTRASASVLEYQGFRTENPVPDRHIDNSIDTMSLHVDPKLYNFE